MAAMATAMSTALTAVPCSKRRTMVVSCSATNPSEKVNGGESVHRRNVVRAAGAVLLSLVATGVANAIQPIREGEPKPGTKEAVKKYANICRSNPTASICHN